MTYPRTWQEWRARLVADNPGRVSAEYRPWMVWKGGIYFLSDPFPVADHPPNPSINPSGTVPDVRLNVPVSPSFRVFPARPHASRPSWRPTGKHLHDKEKRKFLSGASSLNMSAESLTRAEFNHGAPYVFWQDFVKALGSAIVQCMPSHPSHRAYQGRVKLARELDRTVEPGLIAVACPGRPEFKPHPTLDRFWSGEDPTRFRNFGGAREEGLVVEGKLVMSLGTVEAEMREEEPEQPIDSEDGD